MPKRPPVVCLQNLVVDSGDRLRALVRIMASILLPALPHTLLRLVLVLVEDLVTPVLLSVSLLEDSLADRIQLLLCHLLVAVLVDAGQVRIDVVAGRLEDVQFIVLPLHLGLDLLVLPLLPLRDLLIEQLHGASMPPRVLLGLMSRLHQGRFLWLRLGRLLRLHHWLRRNHWLPIPAVCWWWTLRDLQDGLHWLLVVVHF